MIDWPAIWTFVAAWVVIWLTLSLVWHGAFIALQAWQSRRG